MRASAQGALIGGQRIEHGGLRVDVQRRAVLLRQRGQLAVFEIEIVAAAGQMGGARKGHGRVSVSVSEADDGVAGAGAEAAGGAVDAGCAAAGLAGRLRGPFWPHPAMPADARAIAQTSPEGHAAMDRWGG